ncbi:CLUMA_CG015835, isoform A [Clunio marinus]|uniref:CLUMA_CG015835, isoform A n=1 Tax=Clunio marinus TaxID=568069 RepID=A0A1J1IUF2_9DIPT|nr:CLUMA_CG015835, isoform A [Clunio marinus]
MGRDVAIRLVVLILLAVLVSFCCCNEIAPAIIEGPTKAPIGCHKRSYSYKVTQSDMKGNTCSGVITVNACWGRCDSKEISDWKFPFKKSHHPVCVHSGRTKVIVMLQECDPNASIEARKYEYMEALTCSCQICSSIDTSCESPQALQKAMSINKLITTDIEEDYSLIGDKY